MKLECPPGIFTDRPPVASTPFWYYAENIRFRAGLPETIGLYAPILNTGNDEQLAIDLELTQVDFYADGDILVAGHGHTLSILDWESGGIVNVEVDTGDKGRWWFTSIEDGVICSRGCCHSGVVHVIDRETKTVTPLANAPTGSIAGGILGGILILAGAEGVLGDGRRMVVRWSARRSDPSSSGTEFGPFGFEDWEPSDLNSAGEIPLEHGSTIVGGGSTEFGFIVWTDTRMHLLTPRTDIRVFNERQVSVRGLMAQKTWIEADSRVWWFDPTRTLNVFDGGGPRQVPNPMRQSSVETINRNAFERCFMSSIAETSEVILHYPDPAGEMRELVYNYADNAWYPWRMDRIAMTSSHGPRPAIAIDSLGRVFSHDLREVMPFDLLDPNREVGVEPGTPFPATTSIEPTPYSFFLMSNLFAATDLNLQSLRARLVTISHTLASSLYPVPDDTFSVVLRSYGGPSILEIPVHDMQELDIGTIKAQLRGGGKYLQLVIRGTNMRSTMRFGEIEIDADAGGRR